jgi:hypothetical protein
MSESDDKDNKAGLPYEPPMLIDLGGGVAHAQAKCQVGGSPSAGACNTGSTASSGKCSTGGVAGSHKGGCASGWAASGADGCKTGGTAAGYSCDTGATPGKWCKTGGSL